MTREDFFDFCREAFGTEADYPFEGDFETAVLRHEASRKWYAILMRVPRTKLGLESAEATDVVNLKMPTEMLGDFGASEGVYPAYHMNKLHWVSVILADAPRDVVEFLAGVSFEATRGKIKPRKSGKS